MEARGQRGDGLAERVRVARSGGSNDVRAREPRANQREMRRSFRILAAQFCRRWIPAGANDARTISGDGSSRGRRPVANLTRDTRT